VRFDLMQPIARRALHNLFAGSPTRPVALSDEAFALFINHLGRFLLEKNLDTEICADMDTNPRTEMGPCDFVLTIITG